MADSKNNASDNEQTQARALIALLRVTLASMVDSPDLSGASITPDTIRIYVKKIPKGVEITLVTGASSIRHTSLLRYVQSNKSFSLLAFSDYDLTQGMRTAEIYFEMKFTEGEIELITETANIK